MCHTGESNSLKIRTYVYLVALFFPLFGGFLQNYYMHAIAVQTHQLCNVFFQLTDW